MSNDYQYDTLSPAQMDALLTGEALLLDEVFDALEHVGNGTSLEATAALAGCLPPQFQRHYDGFFLRRFLICAARVADRLAAWDEEPIPACTAECLALRAIVDRAKAVLQMGAEEQGDEADDDFEEFEEAAFPDMDVELLFDLSLDGIEDTEVAEYMGMALRPSEWFEPAYGEAHPYCR